VRSQIRPDATMPPTRLGQSGGIVPTSRGMPRRRSFHPFSMRPR
jgi:hypothetical protein